MKKLLIKLAGMILGRSVFLSRATGDFIRRPPFLNQGLKSKLMDLIDTVGPETITRSKVGDITLFYPSKSCIGKFWAADRGRHSFLGYFFQKYLARSNCIIEVGANIGTDTIFMARNVHEDCKLMVFEPADKYRNLLIQNIAENKIRNVLVYDYFVGNSDGAEYDLYLNSASASVIKDASPSFPSVGRQRVVKSITIDSFIANEKVSDVNFLKVDTDGYDQFVLQGSPNAIDRFRPKLLVEFSGYHLERLGASNRSLAQLLFNYGYNDFIVLWDAESPPSYFSDYAKLIRSLDANSSVDVIAVHRNDNDHCSLKHTLQEHNISKR